MHVLLGRISLGEFRSEDSRHLASLVQKLQAKLPVRADYDRTQLEQGTGLIYICAFGDSPHRLSERFDQILSICEASGIGRIESEASVIEDVEECF